MWAAFAGSGIAQRYTFTTIAGQAGVSGTADGANSDVLFSRPSGLALDGAGMPETTPALGPGASWAALANDVVVAGNDYFLINDVGPSSRFFRLRGQ